MVKAEASGREKISAIAVIGASGAGREIALAALRARYRVVLEDISHGALSQATDFLRSALSISESSGDSGDPPSPRLSTANTVESAIREAEFIVETVADELEMKLELFTLFDKFAKPGAIFVTTSALFAPDDIASVTVCRERCVGMRFPQGFASATQIALVPAAETSEETLAACAQVLRRMGKSAVRSFGYGY